MQNVTRNKNTEHIPTVITSISDYVDECIGSACLHNASDIHIDPKSDYVEIKFRIMGKIVMYDLYAKVHHDELVGRMKILSKLRTDIHDRNQDGRFYFEYKKSESQEKTAEKDMTHGHVERIDIRVSILPTFFGENIVMRILRPEAQRDKSLRDLGLTEEQSTLVLDAISREQGLIVIAGPTGSGKTTTIYSVLSILAKKDKNIVTLEDPIEYVIPGIRQVQVSESVDFGFSKALRALLRQDPDVIVIGEIRDSDTAQLAFQASLTGHLVICTIHAEDCAGVYARLSNLGVHKDMMHSLVLMISQRLVDVGGSVDAIDDGASGVPRISTKRGVINKSDGKNAIKRVGIFEVIPVTGTTKVTLFQNSYPEYIRKALRKQGVLLLEDSMNPSYTKNPAQTKLEKHHPPLPSRNKTHEKHSPTLL